MVTTILFDLDATLLPMEPEMLLKADLRGIGIRLQNYGYDPRMVGKAFDRAIHAMIDNDGKNTNESVFWNCFRETLGSKVEKDIPLVEEIYYSEFQKLKQFCGFDPRASQCLAALKDSGYRLILATNPFFPVSIIHSRIRWAGIDPEIFEYITSFVNSSYCKPNPWYYREILDKRNLSAEECLMVGNDVTEDMVAEKVGIKTFLMTDHLLNKENRDIDQWPHGSFPELMNFIREL